MSLEMFVPGERLKYLADGVKQVGLGPLWYSSSEEERPKTLFREKVNGQPHRWIKQIGRALFQEVGNGHRGASGPIAS